MTTREENEPSVSNWVRLANLDEVPPSSIKGFEVGGRQIALYNVRGNIYCTSNICTHAYALLSDGFLDELEIECPLHAGRFSVITGKALCSPVLEDLKIYETKIVDSEILVLLPEGELE